MDGAKSAMVTWTVGRAGEGLQGLGCTISTAANSCTIIADAVVTVAYGSGVGKAAAVVIAARLESAIEKTIS